MSKYRNNRPAMLRSNFEYSAECGYYHCAMCGYDCYPMEVETNEETGMKECPQCDSPKIRLIKYK